MDAFRTRAALQARNVRLLLAPIAGFIDDEGISEILINGHADVRIETRGCVRRTDVRFSGEQDVHAALVAVAQFNGLDLGEEDATFDGRLPDGSRVHAIFPPASRQGICVAIRKSRAATLTMDDLIAGGAVTPQAAEFLALAVELQKNVLISGGTSSGKTTILTVLGGAVPADERILVLEDVNEIRLPNEHVLYLEGASTVAGRRAVTIRDLFKSSLRMRPDRIIIGECRGGEALDMIQAMTSGHSGSMTTLHASTPGDAMKRLETMMMMSGLELPLHAVRSQIASAVDVVIQAARIRDGSRRIVSIAELHGLNEQGEYTLAELFRLPLVGDPASLEWTGIPSALVHDVHQRQLGDRVLLNQALFTVST